MINLVNKVRGLSKGTLVKAGVLGVLAVVGTAVGVIVKRDVKSYGLEEGDDYGVSDITEEIAED